MRVWLDDERPMPTDFTHHVKTAEEAIALLQTGKVVELSLDHDLGKRLTGYDVAKWIEANAAYIPEICLWIHTQNPVGRENMKLALFNASKVWHNRVVP